MSKIRNWFLKHLNKIIISFSMLLVALLMLTFYFVYEIIPISNDECLWIEKKESDLSTNIVFQFVKFEGVAWQAGIRDGDILKSINGIELKNTMHGMDIINRVKKGDYAKYLIERDGIEYIKKVQIKKLVDYQSIAVILLSFFWLVVGTLVLIAKNNGSIQRLFYAIGVSLAIASSYFILWGSFEKNPTFQYVYLRLAIDLFWTLGASYLPFLWMRFFLTFPNEFQFMKKKFVSRFFTYAPLVLYLTTVLFRFTFIYFNRNNNQYYQQFIGNPLTYLTLESIIVGFVLLLISYFRLKSPEEKKSVFVIVFGYAIGVATIAYLIIFNANSTIDVRFNSPEYFMPIIMIAIIPISFGYSIFKYSLMDMSDVFKNTIIYGSATLSLAAMYFMIIYLIGFMISSAIGTQFQGIIAGVVFIIFAVVFQSTKDRFQEVITRKIYPEQFAFRKVLLKFSNEISSVVGLDNILEFTNNTFIDSLSLNNFAIMLWNDNKKVYEYKTGKGIKNVGLQIECVNNGILNILKQKEKIKNLPFIERTEFIEVFPKNYLQLLNEDIYTVIPLQAQNKILGIILVGLKYSGAQFTGTDLELLVAAVNQTAISIENARLYGVELENIKYEQELDNARKIQESLLPKKIPTLRNLDIAGTMIPAMHVGGDYFDVIKVSESKVFVIVGDVSGKGLSASFYMSKLQTMVRLFCTENKTPKEILIEINKLVYDEIDRHSFITISLALFDTDKGTINVCRAGHPPAIHMTNNVSHIYQSQGIGVGLEYGKIFEKMLEEVIVPFEKDDVFLLFSDGITEAMNNRKELFGIENVINTLKLHALESANNIKVSLISSVSAHKGSAEQNDDITLVIVKIV